MESVDKSSSALDNRALLGIFAKQPIPGQVKTRLCPPFDAQTAAAFYRTALNETVQRFTAGHGYQLALCYAGEQNWFATAFPGVELVVQQGDDLGSRMANTLALFFQRGYRQAVLVGSDTPDLPVAIIEQAFGALRQHDLVVGPARDGGYYLIGMTRPHPQLFRQIPWSTDRVLALTLQRARTLGLTVATLPEWDDLDDRAALQRLLQRESQGATVDFLRKRLSPSRLAALLD